MRIYIVRHGETEENKKKIIQGQLDTQLSSEGEKQAVLVAKALQDIPFEACYSSDLRRATSTAERILVHHSGVRLETPPALRERHMGDLQGRVWGNFQGLLSGDGEGKEIRHPESPEAVERRAVEWWNATVVGASAKHILIVSHGGWIGWLIRGLLRKAIRAEREVTVGLCFNTGVTVVEIPRGGGKGKLLQYGDVTHLRGADVVEDNADELDVKS